jgi:hypothetical protein
VILELIPPMPRLKVKCRYTSICMVNMADKGSRYSIYGESPEFSEATEVQELDRVKSFTLETLKALKVKFPMSTKQGFLDAIHEDRPTPCSYMGREISLKELIGSLRDSDFPLHTVSEAANALAAACPIFAESPEGAPSQEF